MPIIRNCYTFNKSDLWICDWEQTLIRSYFTSNFSTRSNLPSTTPSPTAIPTLSEISCSNAEVYQLLKSLKIKTASGPDGISSRMLRGCVPPLFLLTYPPCSTYLSLLALFPLPGKCLTSHQCIRMVTLSWSQTTVEYLSFLFHPNFLNVLSITNL